MKSRDEVSSARSRETKASRAAQPDIARGDTPSGSSEPKRDGQGRELPDERRSASDNERGPVCVVTCLVGDNRLVELVVCSKSNEVLAEQPIDTLAGNAAAPRIPAESNARPTGNDPRFEHLAVVPNATPDPPQTAGIHNQGGLSTGPVEQRDATETRDMRSEGGFTMAGRTQKASDLVGKSVRNSANEELGKIENIVLDPQSGRAIYAVLSFGGFLGMGDKLFAIPWTSLQLPSDAKSFVLNVEKDRLKTASGFDKGNWPNMADSRWAMETHRFYGAEPYWQTGDSNDSIADTQERRGDRTRWYAPSTSWQKCTDLVGKHVRTQKNEGVGELREIVIDPDSGRAIYGILDYRGKRFAIPWESYSLSADSHNLVLSFDQTKLLDSISFSNSNWPDMTDRRWAAEIHRHYGVKPYWPTGDEVSRLP